MSSSPRNNATSSPSSSSSLSPIPSSSTAVTSASTVNKILYVWIPSTLFLLTIFIVLSVSFIRHTRRVLRKRQVLMDYHEANVLCKRPRICRMFSSSVKVKTASTFLSSWHHSSSFDQTVSDLPGVDLRFAPNSQQFANSQFLTVPTLNQMGSSGRDMRSGVEDYGLSPRYRNGAIYGHRNMAFSFEEDLGRSHTKRVRSQEIQPLQGVSDVFHSGQLSMLTNGFMHKEVIASEQDSDHSQSLDNANRDECLGLGINTAAYGTLQSVESSASHSQNSQTFLYTPVSAESNTRSGRSAICSHCGSVLPIYTSTSINYSGARPKKRPKYKRQSAYSESFTLRYKPDLYRGSRSLSGEDKVLSDCTKYCPESDESRPVSEQSDQAMVSRTERRASEASQVRLPMTQGTRPTTAGMSRTVQSDPPEADGTAVGLQVFTIHTHNIASNHQPASKRFALARSESSKRSTTTDESPNKRTESTCLPSSVCNSSSNSSDYGQDTTILAKSPSPPSPSQLLPSPSRSQPLGLKPELLSCNSGTNTSVSVTSPICSTANRLSLTRPSSTPITSSGTHSSPKTRPTVSSPKSASTEVHQVAPEDSIFWLSDRYDLCQQQTLV